VTQTASTTATVQDIEQKLTAAKAPKNLGIYMDHNATTPVAPEAVEAMIPFYTWNFGNASSIHNFGIEARYGLEKARMQVAGLINAADPEDVVFTSCGSESDNIAIRGALRVHSDRKHVITTNVEHKAILEACAEIEDQGYEVTYLKVNRDCKVTAEQVAAAIRPDTLLVSIMFANNETGVIQPIAGIAKVCREKGVLFHSDAVQATGRLPIDVQALGIDMISMSAHKLYGPKGIGALYVRPGLELRPMVVGGSQERGLSAGTENVAAVAAFGAAAKLARKGMDEEAVRLTALRKELFSAIRGRIEGVEINGHEEARLPGTLNLRFSGLSGQRLVTEANARGIAISAGSACTSVGTSHSHVLLGMGLSKDEALGSVRISLGRFNTPDHAGAVMAILPDLVKELRAEAEAEGLEKPTDC
jgi:cysteine desulfurase